MSEPKRFAETDVESLVARHLATTGEPIDVERNLKAIQRRLLVAEALDSGTQRRRYSAVLWTSAAAALLLVGVGLVGYFATNVQASSAAGMLEEVRGRLADVDRCYDVEVNVPRGFAQRFSFLNPRGTVQVWTRGDAFRARIEEGDKQVLWGRDPQGGMWVTDGQRGLYFAKPEIPPALRRFAVVLSLNEKQVTNVFLRQFDLTLDKRTARNGRQTIHAVAKPETTRSPLNEAWLEIDTHSHTLERLELRHRIDDRVFANITFDLVETSPATEPSYSLAGNMSPDAMVFDAKRAEERSKLLVELMGPGLGQSASSAGKAHAD
ncbi:MAG TPA: hypothetical protein VHD36_18610 [Pirellulales bacterium]|nr:hypothetical protein [Pirellulales bacterium]